MFSVHRFTFLAAGLTVVLAEAAVAQSGSQPVGPVEMPPVTVTAQKEPEDAQKLPVSVTAVQATTLERGGATMVSEAAGYAPNTFFSELSARKVSDPTFRGIGSSPANPGITTFIDGVPQLNTTSSNLSLAGVGQIEFVRGPESPLFGRNTLGGVVNISSRRPELANWGGRFLVPFGSDSARGFQGSFSGPLKTDTLGLGVAFDFGQRDGFSTNAVTGNEVDNRDAFSGKAQLLWTPNQRWETRVIVTAERDRDGDYALNDLPAVRQNPYEVARDFEGRTDRDVASTTVLARRAGTRVVFSSVTGFVSWKAHDLTDLDYSPMPLVRRNNLEEDFQFTQELRWASSAAAPVRISDNVNLRWQGGVFLFTQHYTQDAVNSYAPYLISPFIDFPTDQHTPRSTLDDLGLGLFGQATFVVRDRVDVAVGARFDRETRDALLETFFDQPLPGATKVETSRTFSNVSPRVSGAFHLTPERMVYVSAGQGFKAGGFNPAAPAGSEAFDEEHAWHYEGGWKSSWAGGRLVANASAFYIDWKDMQLNVPDPFVPGQFYISNVGGATSRGVEMELVARPVAGVSLFTSIGQTRARFAGGSVSSGVDVSNKKIQNTPDYTAMFGAEVAKDAGSRGSWFGRLESVSYGAFKYDPSNTVGQDAYTLVNLRAGLRGGRLLAQAWVRNALDTRFVPIAFPFLLAPSGYVGEPGRPRTFGVELGVAF